METRTLAEFAPWPIEALRDRLLEGDLLWRLCRRKDADDGPRATREHLLERAFIEILSDCRGEEVDQVVHDHRLADIVGSSGLGFFGTCEVDVAFSLSGRWHLCEVKSSKVNYRRNDSVVGKGMGRWLEEHAFPCKTLHEIEQDYIRLLHYPSVSPSVESCLFVLVDAFEREPTLWSNRLGELATFSTFMRSPWTRAAAGRLTSATMVVPLETERMKARLIVCQVHTCASMQRSSQPTSRARL